MSDYGFGPVDGRFPYKDLTWTTPRQAREKAARVIEQIGFDGCAESVRNGRTTAQWFLRVMLRDWELAPAERELAEAGLDYAEYMEV